LPATARIDDDDAAIKQLSHNYQIIRRQRRHREGSLYLKNISNINS